MEANRETLRRRVEKVVECAGLLIALLIGVGIGYVVRWATAPSQTRGLAAPATQPAAAPVARAEVWTCPMHPQVRMPGPGRCPICEMPLERAALSDAGAGRTLTISESARKLMAIETSVVERKFVSATVRMVGKVDYDETRLAHITAWVPGRLDRLFVDYIGMPVRKGDHMVELYSPELLSAQEELLQAIQAVKNLKGSDIGIVREATEATVTAVREKLRLWGLTPGQIAAIEKRGKADDHITIHAPIGGVVIDKHVQQGAYVKTGTRIYTIADLSQVWIKLDAYESDLAWLAYGQKVKLTPEAYPGRTFPGTVSFISPLLDSRTRTVKVRVNAPNAEGKLKPGMFVRATVGATLDERGKVLAPSFAGKWVCPMHPAVISDRADARCSICGMALERAEALGIHTVDPAKAKKPLVIPASAALKTGRRAIVYVDVTAPGGKPTFEGREVVLGPRAGKHYIVRGGLTQGQRVVTRGNFLIDSAMQLQYKPSMMSPRGGTRGGHQHHGHGEKSDE